MAEILRIEDVKIIEEDGKKVVRYVFNDDKIVRVDSESDKIITENVSEQYLSIIDAYLMGQSNSNMQDTSRHTITDEEKTPECSGSDDANNDENENDDSEEEPQEPYVPELDDWSYIEHIKSGKGTVFGAITGILSFFVLIIVANVLSLYISALHRDATLGIAVSIIGLLIFLTLQCACFLFSNKVSNKTELKKYGYKSINFTKGFCSMMFCPLLYLIITSVFVFGGDQYDNNLNLVMNSLFIILSIIVSYCFNEQWKEDMLSTIRTSKSKTVANKHIAFKIFLVLAALSSIIFLVAFHNAVNYYVLPGLLQW